MDYFHSLIRNYEPEERRYVVGWSEFVRKSGTT